MKLWFIINYRLDLSNNQSKRMEIISVPTYINICMKKDDYLLYFCGKVKDYCNSCNFYKTLQVMEPYSERPARIKYMISLPSNDGIILDIALSRKEFMAKAKVLKDYFEIANQQNKSDLNIKYAILLVEKINIEDLEIIEEEYKIKIFSLENALKFVKERV